MKSLKINYEKTIRQVFALVPGVALTGSVSLAAHGVFDRSPKDIDFIATGFEEAAKFFVTQQVDADDYEPDANHCRFIINGIDVCFFRVDEVNAESVKVKGMGELLCASVDSAIDAKVRYVASAAFSVLKGNALTDVGIANKKKHMADLVSFYKGNVKLANNRVLVSVGELISKKGLI